MEQAKHFLEITEKEKMHIPYLIAIFCGLRRGEVLGLKWEDIDLGKGKLRVRRSLTRINGRLSFKEPKTLKSKRQISISPFVITKLKEHKNKQEVLMTRFAQVYQNNDLIICTEVGKPKEPRNLLREFYRLTEKANIPRISFHDLRHTHATHMLEIGENPKIVAERLGHTRVAITLDTYSHVNQDMQDRAADKFESAYFSS
ncbi:site-specific integrase [Alkalihalophilus lindianensis]|uniref:Site-specific integrase n=1 Tax=Alkalihalophilus lindianensis TaxID=1630542 RepID=A0ABU3X7Y5_9BACI|nr:site-specific integrase [Alkalihalophilus lindianensis]MDV2684010.1 site-specific integrase [Alkalihalophilus lindianensis]